MYSHNVDVHILVNGRPVREYTHQGKVFVEAKHWTEYSIKIRNNGSLRRLLVVTVDGINVLDGEAGGNSKAGYVIEGYNSLDIKGFRTSNDVVHPFKFNRTGRSYAAKSDVTKGDTSNCGVIGVEVYAEKVNNNFCGILHQNECQPHITWRTPIFTTTTDYTAPNITIYNHNVRAESCSRSADRQDSTTCMSASPLRAVEFTSRGFDMGTEFSEREVTDRVYDVEFEIGAYVGSVAIFYASKEALEEMGVPIVKKTHVAWPNPFPSKFCRPPNR